MLMMMKLIQKVNLIKVWLHIWLVKQMDAWYNMNIMNNDNIIKLTWYNMNALYKTNHDVCVQRS